MFIPNPAIPTLQNVIFIIALFHTHGLLCDMWVINFHITLFQVIPSLLSATMHIAIFLILVVRWSIVQTWKSNRRSNNRPMVQIQRSYRCWNKQKEQLLSIWALMHLRLFIYFIRLIPKIPFLLQCPHVPYTELENSQQKTETSSPL